LFDLKAECCGYENFLSMNRLTTLGYESYAASVAMVEQEHSKPAQFMQHARSSAPLIAPCGRAFELVYNISKEPLEPESLFSCLYHSKVKTSSDNRVASAATDLNAVARPACAIDGMGTGGHPSPLGSYLVACVLYATMFKQGIVLFSLTPLSSHYLS
jgi:hypothetical protein